MRHIVIALLALGIATCGIGDAMAHGAYSLTPAGLTPSNFFYFLDRFGETLQEFFTFNPEGKVRLQLQFASERMSELQIELEIKGDGKGLETAKERLAEHIEKANIILKEETDKGNDFEEEAREFDEGLKSIMNEAYEDESDDLLREIESVEDKLAEDLESSRFFEESLPINKIKYKEPAKPSAPESLRDIDEGDKRSQANANLELLDADDPAEQFED